MPRTMDWTADTIRQLRADAQMTQSQLARWLGVTVKQVKHLENRRRNPSGPVGQLLGILESRLKSQTSVAPKDMIQVLGASPSSKPPPLPLPENVRDSSEAAFIWG